MSSGVSRPDITIPKDALDLAVGVWYGTPPDEVDPEDTAAAEADMRARLEAAAPLVLAAELERLIEGTITPDYPEDGTEWSRGVNSGLGMAAMFLRERAAFLREAARAAELRGGDTP